jgi:hypothetical protein
MIASALRQGDIGPRGPFQVAQKIYLLETIMPTATHLRGAIPSPPSFIAAAPVFQTVVGAPPNTITIPAQLSMWGNDTYGDCVTAEEAFAKACSNPEIFIPQSTVISWATAHNVLNGATLSGVLQTMQSDGFQQNGNIYDDGGYARVMYTNSGNLMSAIAVGPTRSTRRGAAPTGSRAGSRRDSTPIPPKTTASLCAATDRSRGWPRN